MHLSGWRGCGGRKPLKNQRNPSKSLPDLEKSLQSPNIDFDQISDFYSVSKRRNGVLSIHNHKTYFLKYFSKHLWAIPRLYDQFSMKNRLWWDPADVDPYMKSQPPSSLKYRISSEKFMNFREFSRNFYPTSFYSILIHTSYSMNKTEKPIRHTILDLYNQCLYFPPVRGGRVGHAPLNSEAKISRPPV